MLSDSYVASYLFPYFLCRSLHTSLFPFLILKVLFVYFLWCILASLGIINIL